MVRQVGAFHGVCRNWFRLRRVRKPPSSCVSANSKAGDGTVPPGRVKSQAFSSRLSRARRRSVVSPSMGSCAPSVVTTIQTGLFLQRRRRQAHGFGGGGTASLPAVEPPRPWWKKQWQWALHGYSEACPKKSFMTVNPPFCPSELATTGGAPAVAAQLSRFATDPTRAPDWGPKSLPSPKRKLRLCVTVSTPVTNPFATVPIPASRSKAAISPPPGLLDNSSRVITQKARP